MCDSEACGNGGGNEGEETRLFSSPLIVQELGLVSDVGRYELSGKWKSVPVALGAGRLFDAWW